METIVYREHTRPIEILLVEDNDADVELFREALKGTDAQLRVHLAQEGQAAINFVREGPVRPDLIVLDLNLPKKHGHEVLAYLKSDPKTKLIPVVILTSSQSAQDVRKSYELCANSYVRKPSNLRELFEMADAMRSFWLNWAI